jgi:ComF family protein
VRTRSIGAYDGSLAAIVRALKYDSRRSLARPLAARMREHAGDVPSDVVFVVPVPLHPSRLRARGFNQAFDLARHVGPPVCQALRRVRHTITQTDLPAAERHRNVRGAFTTTRAAQAVAGRIVMLVDDVTTTGATLEACARALYDAGAEEVRAITAARAVTSPPSDLPDQRRP